MSDNAFWLLMTVVGCIVVLGGSYIGHLEKDCPLCLVTMSEATTFEADFKKEFCE